MDDRERIEASSEKVPESGCWIWLKSLRGKGYGQYTHPNRRQEGAHRVSYRTFRGEIPRGMHVCHRCDVPSCVNPAHLFLGTASDNAIDAVRKGFWRPGRVGSPRKVPIADHAKIVEIHKGGLLQKDIAERYGVSQVRISQIIRRFA